MFILKLPITATDILFIAILLLFGNFVQVTYTIL